MARVIGRGYDFDDVLIVPKYNKIKSRQDVSFRTRVTKNYEINLPILSANMDSVTEYELAVTMGRLGGLGVIHRFMTIQEQAEQVKKISELGLLSAAAIGIKDLELRARALVEAGVKILVIDIAHGHSKYAGKALDYLKEKFPQIDVIVGNIATKDGAEYFLSKGADAIKVGIGPGKVCITRDMTGAGVPQLTAIMDVYEATQGRIPIIADGGIRKPADVSKALGAGANAVMCGFIFAGCDESPKQNIYRGSASEKVKGEPNFVEGKEIKVENKGPLKNIIEKYLQGLASGMTYVGADKMSKFIGKVDFILRN